MEGAVAHGRCSKMKASSGNLAAGTTSMAIEVLSLGKASNARQQQQKNLMWRTIPSGVHQVLQGRKNA